MREMKYSGMDSIGDIPVDWKVQRLRTILKLRSEKNSGDRELLSVFEVHTSWFKNGSKEVQELFYKYLNLPLPKAVKKFIYHHLLNNTALYSKLTHNSEFAVKVEDIKKLKYAYLKANRYSCKTLNFLQKLNK